MSDYRLKEDRDGFYEMRFERGDPSSSSGD